MNNNINLPNYIAVALLEQFGLTAPKESEINLIESLIPSQLLETCSELAAYSE